MSRDVRDPFPDFAVLVEWVEGRLDSETSAEVSAAVLAGNPETTASVRWLKEFREVAQAMPLHQPPPLIRQNLFHYFTRWSQARATLDHPRLELKARLLFDSRLDLAPVGVRGPNDVDGLAHLAYTTDHADVVLDVNRVGSGMVRLDGQVLLTDDAQPRIFEAVVSGPSGTRRTIDGDTMGRFSLVDVPQDAEELRVTNGDLTIVLALDLHSEG